MRGTVDRRALLGRGLGSGLAFAVLGGGLAGCARSGAKADEDLGAARSVAFAIGTPGSDFVHEISLGCADAAEALGWRFTRVLNAQPTPDAHVNAIRQAVTARNDVVVTVDWYQAVVEEVVRAQPQGTRFAMVNSLNNADDMAKYGVPFSGQNPSDVGRLLGARMAQELGRRGTTQGAVLVGNPFPGSLNVEQRIAGIAEGLKAQPGLRMVSFADGSAADAATSVALYKAKIQETGNVVGHAAASGEMGAVPLLKALDELGGPAPLVGSTVSSLKMLDFVKQRRVAFALDENLYMQGFSAVMLAWSAMERGLAPLQTAPGCTWVEAGNVDAMIAGYRKRKEAAKAHGLS